MILQGLFNILSLYLNEIDLFYNTIDQYFRDKITTQFNSISINKENLSNNLNKLLEFCSNELILIGFDKEEISNKLLDPFLELSKEDKLRITSVIELYNKKVIPLVYEIFLEKLVDYLVDVKVAPLMLELKSKGFLNLEFIIELRTFKSLLDNNPEKKENLKKYIQIRENIIKKFCENKDKIESLEDLKDPKDKLQLLYLIHRTIKFLNFEIIFDFSHIKDYLANNLDEWLFTIPLVTLKNPDLYYCGLYLAKHLNVELDKKKILNFLLNLFEEGTDEFEAPLIEATDGLYYYLKSTELVKLWLKDVQVHRLIDTESKFFESSYLKNLETSQLVVILKIFNLLKVKKDENKINAIIDELEYRITPEGIKQYRDGFISSEATYYILFANYMRNSLDKLKDHNLLDGIVSRIYRNIEILDFSADMNYDLLSEIFYSFESLKLFNCIETKQMIIHLAKYLFPPEVVDKITQGKEIVESKARFRHLKVNKITGETIY
ncbi:MAG: hypothetical protein ACFE8J_10415 [Candidatus Heimdallarchaeota archaeon]